MFRLYNVTGGEIVSQLNSSSGGVRVSSSHLEQAARRTGPATLCGGDGGGSGVM